VVLLPDSFKPNELNRTVAFRVARSMSKPQLFDFFAKVHGMKIAKLNTLIQPARVKRDRQTNKLVKSASYKKVYVTLQQPEMITLPKPRPARRSRADSAAAQQQPGAAAQ